MWTNQLKMNNTKTEFTIFGKSNLRKINLDSITVGGITVNSSQMSNFLAPFWMKHCLSETCRSKG